MDPKCQITISAFGKFGNIENNPTSILVNSLSDDVKKKYNIKSAQVVEVSTVGCDNYIQTLPKHTINLHFGVYDGSEHFQIECCGYNQKDFGIPDMRGYKPKNLCINEQCKNNEPCYTNIDTHSLVKCLQDKGLKVINSNDPGRYICNYMYYCSLQNTLKNKQGGCIFVHFPSFTEINQEDQYQFVLKLLETIHELHKSYKLQKKQEQKE